MHGHYSLPVVRHQQLCLATCCGTDSTNYRGSKALVPQVLLPVDTQHALHMAYHKTLVITPQTVCYAIAFCNTIHDAIPLAMSLACMKAHAGLQDITATQPRSQPARLVMKAPGCHRHASWNPCMRATCILQPMHAGSAPACHTSHCMEPNHKYPSWVCTMPDLGCHSMIPTGTRRAQCAACDTIVPPLA